MKTKNHLRPRRGRSIIQQQKNPAKPSTTDPLRIRIFQMYYLGIRFKIPDVKQPHKQCPLNETINRFIHTTFRFINQSSINKRWKTRGKWLPLRILTSATMDKEFYSSNLHKSWVERDINHVAVNISFISELFEGLMTLELVPRHLCQLRLTRKHCKLDYIAIPQSDWVWNGQSSATVNATCTIFLAVITKPVGTKFEYRNWYCTVSLTHVLNSINVRRTTKYMIESCT